MNGTPMHTILMMIAVYKKNVAANTNASLKWLQKQADFAKQMPYYINKWFAYDPSNPKFQEASSFFWDRYSQELDSWRDQPLWSYVLHHFNITPEVLFKKEEQLELFIWALGDTDTTNRTTTMRPCSEKIKQRHEPSSREIDVHHFSQLDG
jgi:hypothetical protein